MKVINRFKARKLTLAIAASLALGAGELLASDQKILNLDVSRQSIGSALVELSKTSGVQIVLSQELGDKVVLDAIKGEFTLTEALDRMLSGSGLTYEFRSDELVVIDEEGSGSVEDAKDVEEVVVTGTMLRGARSASPVIQIDRAEFRRLGASTVEDVIRSLPQNVSTMNTASSMESSNEIYDGVLTPSSQGTSMANLRGLGSAATLVLVNGRRKAGTATSQGRAVNLSTIPLASVERIDVMLDSASAIYGSDAVGGVINIITKKGEYSSGSTSVRYSSIGNGDSEKEISQTITLSDDKYRVTFNAGLQENDPVSAEKAGYTSADKSSFGGTNWYDYITYYSTPGRIRNIGNGWGYLGSLPSSFDGTEDWSEADLVESTPSPKASAREHVRPSTKSTSISMDFEYELSEDLEIFGDLQFTENKTESIRSVSAYWYNISADNPFNQLGREVRVYYSFENEVENGLIPGATEVFTRQKSRSGVLGANYSLPFKDWKVELTYSRDEDSTKLDQFGFNYSSSNDSTGTWDTLLSSLDPTEAFNPFGNGSAQSPLISNLWGKFYDTENSSESNSWNLKVDGELLTLWEREVRFAAGLQSTEITLDLSKGFYDNTAAHPYPGRDSLAAFIELGSQVSENLYLKVASRYDRHENHLGQVQYNSSADRNDPDRFVILNDNGAVNSKVTSKVDVIWNPLESVQFTASWGQSFIMPRFQDVMDPPTPDVGQAGAYSTYTYDWVNEEYVTVDTQWGGNPNLKPETAVSKTFGVKLTPEFLEGLVFGVTYSDIDYTNRIKKYYPWPGFIGESEGKAVYSDPNIAVRDESGALIGFRVLPVNIATRRTKSLDFDANYTFDTSVGQFGVELVAMHSLKQYDEINAESPRVSLLDTQAGAPEWAGRVGLSWTGSGKGLDLIFNHRDGFAYISRGTPKRVDDWRTVDLSGYFEIEQSNILISGGIKNLTNEDFPFLDSAGAPYSTVQVDVRGRVAYLSFQIDYDL